MEYFVVAPHPSRETRERSGQAGLDGRQAVNDAIVGGRVRPVCLDRNDVEAVIGDEIRRDFGAGVVELGRAVRGLAQHDDPAISEQRCDNATQILVPVERMDGLPQLVADLARRSVSGGNGELRLDTMRNRVDGWLGPDFTGSIPAVSARARLRLGKRGPFLRSDQRHEGDKAVGLLLEALRIGPADARQHLVGPLTHRNDEPSSDRQLLLERGRHDGPASRNQDGVEGRSIRPALRAVTFDDLDIAIAEVGDALARLLHQHLVALDGDDVLGEPADHRSRVSGAGADFEHRIVRPDLGELHHLRHDVRLRDGLPGFDRQRRILIGELAQSFGHEGLPRDHTHGLKHPRVLDALPRELMLDHGFPLPLHDIWHDGISLTGGPEGNA